MSLDVYLKLEVASVVPLPETERIFVRKDGATVEVSREEWDDLHPGREPVVATIPLDPREVFTANITHNLGKMAAECDLYEPLWRPDKVGIEKAGQLIGPLRDGLGRLRGDRKHFEQFNPENGWGDYDGLVRFIADYLAACEIWPEANVRTCV